ncbi:hypothetical protein D0Z08_06505 [Nocardioides immobilis]|uniref:Uncharacterized protein n=1 Tax=Nocardioides immobilis TaxID=2049295 RepID=A0A417Y5W3_9ACTN|nr:hypothetical protein [Nocardioides immobilis]RHW27931.1 hypothetical protein D0Z08_06505 [Nocardioides immobilis]
MIKRPLVFLLALVLVVGAAVAGGYWWLNRGPDYPDEWDSRVDDLVEFVEDERGLEFEHPVYIDFLSEEAFEKEVTSEESDLTDEDKEEIEQVTGLMRALGLIDHDVDLFDAANDLTGGGIIGLYDPEDERIRMRGEELTPTVEATLVHELTHVLQDQHFDLEEKDKELEEAVDSSATAAWDALVEGDANRIETAWVADLSAKEKKALDKDEEKQGKGVRKKLKDVPPFLRTQLGSSYAFGEALLALATEIDGDEAVDELFEDPPVTEEHLLDPWTLIDGDQDAISVDKPDLKEGEDEFDDGTFGSPSLLFVLAERIDVQQALKAADGWGGDQYVAFERDKRSCIRVDYRGDTQRDVAELRGALKQWIADGPSGIASVRDHEDGLRFESCDPGREAVGGNGGSQAALELAVGRTTLATQGMQQGATEDQARCFASEVVRAFTIDDLEELNTAEPDPALIERVQTLAVGCR